MGERRDEPWVMRTYAGYGSPRVSNLLYKKNLAKGQTGLSVAFDLPTQTGYDSDHPLARGEVGKVGVPINHLADMKILFEGIPLKRMNTSMTINATAPWLLALYIVAAIDEGGAVKDLQGTTQNDILKEYLSRGTYIFSPGPSMRLTVDTIAFCAQHLPRWNPINICSYHLQEAGATPVQEIAFTLANAIAVLDAVRDSGKVSPETFPQVVGRISFFVNAGIRFVEEICKVRTFVRMWDRITQTRYEVQDPRYRLFRYGVQVNSLGLTERQPENNIIRIVLETLAVTLSREARARAIQLPAWNEALGLPRPWDQQWSLRIQQILAHETDLLEYGDLIAGSPVIEEKVRSLEEGAETELQKILQAGGSLRSIEAMKTALVASHRERIRRIESGEEKVVGVNCFTESERSPLIPKKKEGFLKTDPKFEREQIARLVRHRSRRNEERVRKALDDLVKAAREEGANILPASIECAKAGVTTGEWGYALREVFGEYRAPTGLSAAGQSDRSSREFDQLRKEVAEKSKKLRGPIRLLLGKPGLDGHSSGVEQVALRAREAGFEVIYPGIRMTPAEIVAAARDEGVHAVGLSILSGSHLELIFDIMRRMKKEGINGLPVIVGGIIPESDKPKLKKMGVRRVYTPKDFELNTILSEIISLL